MFRFTPLALLTALSVLIIVATAGCREDWSPTAPATPNIQPSNPTETKGLVYGAVTSAKDNQCLAGASIELMDGSRAGERVEQSAAACESLYDITPHAFAFRDLPTGTPVTVRASMPGYQSRTLALNVIPGTSFFHHSGSVAIPLTPLP